MKFKRNCPKCNKKITYTTERALKLAIKKNSNCLTCFNKIPKIEYGFAKKGKNHWNYGGKRYTKKWKDNISKSGKGRVVSNETVDKMFITKYNMTRTAYLKTLPEYISYRKIVRNITEKQPLHLLENFNKRGKIQYHLDHIVSIQYGFLNNISPKIIGNIKNLQMLWWNDNLHKSYHIKEDTVKKLLKELKYETS